MIFRKPYAFLIKYFKLINFALAILAINITYRSYNIISFFNEYITQKYSGNFYPGFSENYISLFVYVVVILILIGLSFICLLFRYKKKPLKIYFVSVVYYIILYIFLILIKNTMITMETTVISAEVSRIYRDLSMIFIVPQVIFIIMFLLKGLGFNLNKYKFKEDIKELQITEQDDEEIEITFKQDAVKIKRNIRRFGREFAYYIKENKFVFLIICICLIIGLGLLIYKSIPETADESYNQGENFSMDGMTYSVADSIITNLDYKGDIIGDNLYYIVTRLYIENSSSEDYVFDYNDFRLMINDNYVYPSVDKGNNFIDYAENNYTKIIKGKSKKIYSLVFRINEKEVKKSYKLKITRGSSLTNNLIMGNFNYVTITPIVINKVVQETKVNLGELVSFSDSNLSNSTLRLSNAYISDKYIYNYEHCTNEFCNTYKDIINIDYTKNNKMLLVLDYEYSLDKETPFYKYSSSIDKFIETFMKVQYLEDGEYKYYNVKNVTPKIIDGKMILETTEKIKDTEKLSVSVTIRNKEYLIRIK